MAAEYMVVEYKVEMPLEGITIEIEKVGGGTIGRKHDGLWKWYYGGPDYSDGGETQMGIPRTHAEVAQLIYDYFRPKL
jgi:hypothetical protein